MAECYFAYGAALGSLVNIETAVPPPHILPDHPAPAAGSIRVRTLDRVVRREGALITTLAWSILDRGQFNTLIRTLFGGYEIEQTILYMTLLDDTAAYSPYLVTVDRPYPGEQYQIADGGYIIELKLVVSSLILQRVVKATSASLTTAERLARGDTTAGNVTLTLPAASAVQPDTIMSIEKAATANLLTVQRAGGDTINGGTSVALSTLWSRVDLASNGINQWRTIKSS